MSEVNEANAVNEVPEVPETEAEKLLREVQAISQMVVEIDEDYSKLTVRVTEVERLREDVSRLLEEVRKLSLCVVTAEGNARNATQSALTALANLTSERVAPLVAEHLATKVLVTRPATREEQKAGVGIAVRAAARGEK